MIIGIDFDNTIVRYDAIFRRIALERGLVPAEVPASKTAVRDYLRGVGQEPAFTELQGYVYGPRLVEAEMFPGVKEFFRACKEHAVTVKIISHKTRFPYAGANHDLHAAARGWLEHHGFFASSDIGLSPNAVYFELTKGEKIARIATAQCDVFIDDLPELLAEPGFPVTTRRILFDPMDTGPDSPSWDRTCSWGEITRLVFDSPDNRELSVAAQRLFNGAGMQLAAAPVRFAGGANNRVFLAWNVEGARFLIKQYFFQAGDQQNRFESECRFYQLAASVAPNRAPRALGWDAQAKLALLEFVEGRKLLPGEIRNAELGAALDFFRALNARRDSPEAGALPLAAEACFTMEEHCRAVDRRLERLAGISDQPKLNREARHFVATELTGAWSYVRAAVLSYRVLAGVAADTPIPRIAWCVSPSDFGFHNCLRRSDGNLVFLDFEYAGWDDPAKMVCDFFCQPALPAPLAAFQHFAGEVARAVQLPAGDEFVTRCGVLLPLYRLKWCCIMLNEFVRADHGRRAFALGADVAEKRKVAQLAAARNMLALAVTATASTAEPKAL